MDGPSKGERKLIQTLFPENDSYFFDASRQSLFDGYLYVIITSDKPGENIYTAEHMQQIIQLNDDLLSVDVDGKSYQGLCSSYRGVCRQNTWLNLLNGTGQTILNNNISYPIHKNQYFWGFQLGNVRVNQDGFLTSVEAVQLSYSLRYVKASDVEESLKWMRKAKDYLLAYKAPGLTIDCSHGKTLDEELEKSVSGVISKFAIAYTVLMTFCVMSCVMFDWVGIFFYTLASSGYS